MSLIETLSAAVHDAWRDAKWRQGVSSRQSESGEELMVAYDDLSEAAKDLDRSSVKAILDAISASSAIVITEADWDELLELINRTPDDVLTGVLLDWFDAKRGGL